MSNHIVIGLGGTGGSTLLALRKQVYRNLQTDDPSWVNVRYLYMDTDDRLIKGGDRWRVLGHSVALEERSWFPLEGVSLGHVIQHPDQFPGISPWLGDRSQYGDLVQAADDAKTGAGQRRRLGRFIFAPKAKLFTDRLKQLVNSTREPGRAEAERTQRITFHVCAGLAGGTGSGALLDVLAQIRKQYPQDEKHTYPIIVYAVLPAREPPPEIDTRGYYWANGYAALKELNAAVLGLWRPHDLVTGDGRVVVQSFFDSCYLMGDVNTANVPLNVRDEIPELLASYLYQRVVERDRLTVPGKDVDALEKFENPPIDGPKELDEVGVAVRTKRFLSFGIRQVVYPQTEIREYLSYSFALEALRQALYNNWADGAGFLDKKGETPLTEWVHSPATLGRWFLTLPRLTLSQGILEKEQTDKSWVQIPQFWDGTLARYVGDVQQSPDDKRLWIYKLKLRCDKLFNEEYRGHGVARFYQVKRSGDLAAQVRFLRQTIERDLFQAFRDGERSLDECRRAVEEVVSVLDDVRRELDHRVAEDGPLQTRLRTVDSEIERRNENWAKVGILLAAIGERKRLLMEQAESFKVHYTVQTEMEASRYARDLVKSLRQEMEGLSAILRESVRIATDAEEAVGLAKLSRCRDFVGNQFAKERIACYEPKVVRDYVATMTTDQKLQASQASALRGAVLKRLVTEQTFAEFNRQFSGGELLDLAVSVAQAEAVSADDSRDRDGRILRLKVIEKLRRQFGGNDEELQKYFKDVVKLASQNLELNNDELSNEHMTTNYFCILPEAPEQAEFRDKIAEKVKQNANGVVEIATNASRDQEITLLTAASVFPARYARVVKFLKEAYDKWLLQGDRHYLALHLEGVAGHVGEGQRLPDLFREEYTPEVVRPYALLASAMRLLQMAEDIDRGVPTLYLNLPGPSGRVDSKPVGTSLTEFIEQPKADLFLKLRPAVEQELETKYLHREQRSMLVRSLEAERKEALELPPHHPLYRNAAAELKSVEDLIAQKEAYANR